MAILLELVDGRDVEVTGPARLQIRVTRRDGTIDTTAAEHPGPGPFPLNVQPDWRLLDLAIAHDDYFPLSVSLRWDTPGASVAWSDPPTTLIRNLWLTFCESR